MAHTDVSARIQLDRQKRLLSFTVSCKMMVAMVVVVSTMVSYKLTTFHRQARFQEFLTTLSYSEMPSKIPTYSVYPNNSPDTDYEQDYETPAPGPPPTRSGHQNLDEDKDKIDEDEDKIPNSL